MRVLLEMGSMARLAIAASLRLAGDALGDYTGASLPYRADDVAQPEALSALMNSGLVDATLGPVHIRALSRQDIPSVSSNCHNLVLSIEQEEGGQLPDSLFVKLPMESRATRWFFCIINSWRLESHFCKHVAQNIPLRTPATFATDYRGGRFFLVQENLNIDPAVTLFTNPDMLAGPSLEQVHKCLDAFARLHAEHYDLSRQEQDKILPFANHLFLSSDMGTVSRTLNRLALKPCMKKRPGAIPESVARAYRDSVEHWDTLLEHWFSGPLCLLHGDSHLGNFFVDGDEMGMLDWQAVHWGKGIRDVQYFLIDSLPPSVLAANERALVDYYVRRRGHYGTAIDPEEAWQDYRGFTFHTLMTIVVSIGFGALNEDQDALMTEILKRSVAAVQRVDYADWLQQRLAG
ncbi:MAG: hypothetical protein ACI9NT_002483 [Bacteroidia bacterium]|jgi:hypothetical protein